MIQIGPYSLTNRLGLAPMAGVTDLPFRKLCRRMGAGLATSEMVTSQRELFDSAKTSLRMQHDDEPAPISVQIAGSEASQMADAAQFNVEHGAQIIDINMGCPAKKVCKKAAGSALLANEALVEEILTTVVNAVDVPVTLKIRTGIDTDNRNAIRIARIAENAGIAALAIHGRTKACKFMGHAEYGTIAAVKQAIAIPLFANGDIDSPEKAAQVLRKTGADGLLIGRAAQGRPWIFREINHYLEHGTHLASPSVSEQQAIMLQHVSEVHAFYMQNGAIKGVRIARKHIDWYLKAQVQLHPGLEPVATEFRRKLMASEDAAQQLEIAEQYFTAYEDITTQLAGDGELQKQHRKEAA